MQTDATDVEKVRKQYQRCAQSFLPKSNEKLVFDSI